MLDRATIRARYRRALDLGYPAKVAAQIANGRGSLPEDPNPANVPADVPPPPPEVAARIAQTVIGEDDIKTLRARYTELTGKKPFPGWPVEVLAEKIAAATAG